MGARDEIGVGEGGVAEGVRSEVLLLVKPGRGRVPAVRNIRQPC